MGYEVDFMPQANAQLDALDNKVEGDVRRKIAEMAASAGVWKHRGLTGRYSGQFRLRVGNYRVVYELDHPGRRVLVVGVRHRSEAYD